jgi:hypothetical protein
MAEKQVFFCAWYGLSFTCAAPINFLRLNRVATVKAVLTVGSFLDI